MVKLGNLLILGDSYSTFEGYIPDSFEAYYSESAASETGVDGVEQTWWMRLIRATESRLLLNSSWSGTTICNTGYCGDCSGSSFITRFDQLAEGGPITVTHPDVVRYFMTIPEAVSLVLEAGAISDKSGEIFVLDMGNPVKILTLAENLIKLSGKIPYRDIDIVFTGLRPGEKMYEELLQDEEGIRKTENSKIFIGSPLKMDADRFFTDLLELKGYAYENDRDNLMRKLQVMVPTFKHEIIDY